MTGITVDLTRKYTKGRIRRKTSGWLSKNADAIKITASALHAVNMNEEQVWKCSPNGWEQN